MEYKKIFSRNFVMVFLLSVVAMIAAKIESNLYPIYMRDIGFNIADVGIFTSIVSIACCIGQPFIGLLLDSRGRKRILLLGLLIDLIGAVGFSMLVQYSILPDGILFSTFLILRSLQGIGFAMYALAATTIITDSLSNRQMIGGISIYYNSSSIASAIGSVIGLAMASSFGYFCAFNAIVLLMAIAMIFICCIGETGTTEKTAFNGRQEHKYKVYLFEKKSIRHSLMMCYYELPMSAVFSYVTLFSQELKIKNAGIFYIFYVAAMMTIRMLISKLLVKISRNQVLIIGMSLVISGIACLFLAESEMEIILGALLIGIGDGLNFSIINESAIREAPESHRGMANATFGSLQNLGLAIGCIFWGIVGDIAGLRNIYLYSEIFMVIGVIYCCINMKGKKKLNFNTYV